MLKKIILALLVAACVITPAMAEEDSGLTTVSIVNDTGTEIYNIYFSPEDASVWGPDLLKSDQTLEDGDSHEFNVLFENDSFSFSLMVVDEDDYSYTLTSQVLQKGQANTFTITRAIRGDTVNLNLIKVTLENTLDYDIYYLFVSPDESAEWGPDILASDQTFDAGESISFFVPVTKEYKYNVRAIDEDGDSYSFNITLRPKSSNPVWEIEASDMD